MTKEIYIAVRVGTEPPLVASVIRYCAHCGQQVWISKENTTQADMSDLVLCVQCATDYLKKRPDG